MSRVVVALSGGVDSTAAALKLLQDGYEVTGLTLKLFNNNISEQAIADAGRVCQELGIDHHVMNVTEEFDRSVVTNFCEYYRNGMTPSPCLRCNPHFKWTKILSSEICGDNGFLATGHYAVITQWNGRTVLKRSAGKDQSYFLHRLPQKHIARTMFPIGNYEKTRVRTLVEEAGLHVAHRPDSQEVCFIKDAYSDFLADRFSECPPEGDIVDLRGRVRGHHKGLYHYTVGQRSGLGISAPNPLYVIRLEPQKNQLIVGEKRDVFSQIFFVKDLIWSAIEPPEQPMECKVQVRYRQTPVSCRIVPEKDSRFKVEFVDPPGAVIAPGQGVAFYKDDIVLGGGEICRDESH